MFIIFLITLTLQKNKKCWCNQYAFRDRCENNPVCIWNFDVAKCQDIPCIDRSIDECKLYGGDLFCVYNQRKAECQTMENCNMLSNDSITNLTTYDECFNKQCFYDFENNTCGYVRKICRDYDSLHCSGAFQVVGYDLVQCQLNGNDGRQCDLVLTCSDITYKGSCDVNIYCQWEDKKCVPKKCVDYEKLQDCPSFNPYAQELCIPISGNCTAFKCDQIQTSLQCIQSNYFQVICILFVHGEIQLTNVFKFLVHRQQINLNAMHFIHCMMVCFVIGLMEYVLVVSMQQYQ